MGFTATGKCCLGLAALISASVILPAQANTLSLNYGQVFSTGSVAPDGGAPYLTATFDDGNTPGSVTLTMSVSPTVGGADVDELYFNFDPTLDLTQLAFAYNSASSTGPAAAGGGNNGIFVGVDAFQADGDGKFDINLNFPPPPGTGASRWNGGETVIYNITSTESITADSFRFLSAPGGGAGGPFLSAAHFLSTGLNGNDSAWVGAVPIPAAVWLFISGLLGLVGLARNRN